MSAMLAKIRAGEVHLKKVDAVSFSLCPSHLSPVMCIRPLNNVPYSLHNRTRRRRKKVNEDESPLL